MSIKISGRTIAARIKEQVSEELKTMKRTPGIAAILVGDDPASHIYVGLKQKECASIGIHFDKILFPETITEAELAGEVAALNTKNSVDAILVQMPLPKHINADKIIAAIQPDKDVDGFQINNPHVRPVLLQAIEEILKSTGVPLRDKKTIVICNSEIFCSSMQGLQKSLGLRVSCLNARQLMGSQHIESQEKKHDIVIVAAGVPKLVTSAMIKDNAIVVDIGTNKTDEGTIGDVAPSAFKKTSFYTPVPGGVGPVTVACLLRNAVELAKLHQK